MGCKYHFEQLLEKGLVELGMPLCGRIAAEQLVNTAEHDELMSPQLENVEELMDALISGMPHDNPSFAQELILDARAHHAQLPKWIRHSLIKNGWGIEYKLSQEGTEFATVHFDSTYKGVAGVMDHDYFVDCNANALFICTLSNDGCPPLSLFVNAENFINGFLSYQKQVGFGGNNEYEAYLRWSYEMEHKKHPSYNAEYLADIILNFLKNRVDKTF